MCKKKQKELLQKAELIRKELSSGFYAEQDKLLLAQSVVSQNSQEAQQLVRLKTILLFFLFVFFYV